MSETTKLPSTTEMLRSAALLRLRLVARDMANLQAGLAAIPNLGLLAALEDVTDAVERMALRLDEEPGNQTVVALWLHKVNAARAAITKARGRAPAPPERDDG